VRNAEGAEHVTIDHPNKTLGQIVLMKALGTTDDDFLGGLIKQLVSVGSQGAIPDQSEFGEGGRRGPACALMVPNGCSAVWRRMRMVSGARSSLSWALSE